MPSQTPKWIRDAARRAVRELLRISPVTDLLAEPFAAAGHQLWIVGGPVRDALLGREAADLDFTTDAHPEVVLQLVSSLGPTWTTGISFGTVGVQVAGHRCAITTFRSHVLGKSRHQSTELAGPLRCGLLCETHPEVLLDKIGLQDGAFEIEHCDRI